MTFLSSILIRYNRSIKKAPGLAFPKIPVIKESMINNPYLEEDKIIYASNDTNNNKPISMYESQYVNLSEGRIRLLKEKKDVTIEEGSDESAGETEVPYFINMINPHKHNQNVLNRFWSNLEENEHERPKAKFNCKRHVN